MSRAPPLCLCISAHPLLPTDGRCQIGRPQAPRCGENIFQAAAAPSHHRVRLRRGPPAHTRTFVRSPLGLQSQVGAFPPDATGGGTRACGGERSNLVAAGAASVAQTTPDQ